MHALPAASPNLVLWSVVAAPVATVHRLKRVRRTVIRPTCGSTAAERIYSRTKKGSNRYCPSEQIVSGRAAIARLGSTGKNGQLATNQGESSCLPRVNLPARSGLSHGGRDGDAPPQLHRASWASPSRQSRMLSCSAAPPASAPTVDPSAAAPSGGGMAQASHVDRHTRYMVCSLSSSTSYMDTLPVCTR